MINGKVGFCADCGWEVETFDGLSACPSCGSTHIPCNYENQVNVNINWQELRTLVMWAENWYNQHARKDTDPAHPIFAIAERIRKQHPERAKQSPLTLAGEVQQLVDYFGPANIQHNVPGVEGGQPL